MDEIQNHQEDESAAESYLDTIAKMCDGYKEQSEYVQVKHHSARLAKANLICKSCHKKWTKGVLNDRHQQIWEKELLRMHTSMLAIRHLLGHDHVESIKPHKRMNFRLR